MSWGLVSSDLFVAEKSKDTPATFFTRQKIICTCTKHQICTFPQLVTNISSWAEPGTCGKIKENSLASVWHGLQD